MFLAETVVKYEIRNRAAFYAVPIEGEPRDNYHLRVLSVAPVSGAPILKVPKRLMELCRRFLLRLGVEAPAVAVAQRDRRFPTAV